MTLSRDQEERLRTALGALVDTTPIGSGFEELGSTELSPRPSRISGTLAFGATFVALVAIGGLVVWGSWSSQRSDDPWLESGSDEVVLLDDPLVVRGARAPEPVFDTSNLGVEVRILDPIDVESTVVRVEQGLLTPQDPVIKHVFAGSLTTGAQAGLVQTSSRRHWCLWIVPPNDARPSCSGRNSPDTTPVVGIHPESDLPSSDAGLQGILAWGPLPGEVSVAAVAYGNTAYWQRPVGGIALFDIRNPNQDHISLTAYDRNGVVVDAFVVVGRPQESTP
jgi:hypothetical protein